MSLLSQRLQLKVAQKQILTPGLVQMVTVLQMTRLELKDMIAQLGEGFWRLRLGIGHPGVRELVNPWLLARTSAVEREPLLPGVEVAAEIVPLAIEQGAAVAMQRLHTRSPPKDQG